MPTAQEIYNTLVKDPDLEISDGQTREDAAEAEAQYRARQFMNNVQALSLATQDDEPTSSIKALMNHVKNIGKSMASGSISIAQNLLKASLSSLLSEFNDDSKFFQNNPTFKNSYEKLSDDGKQFFNSLAGSPIDNTVVKTLFQSITNNLKNTPDGFDNDDWIYDVIDDLTTDPEYSSSMGFTPDAIQHATKALETAFPGAVPPPPPFKEESIKADADYGSNNKMQLATPATIENVNQALKNMNSPFQVEFGGSSKLKLKGKGVDSLHNPFPDKTQGRIYNSFINGSNPNTVDDTINLNQLGTYSVADVLNGISHLQAQESTTQATVANEIKEEEAQEFEESQKVAEKIIAENPPKKAPITTGKNSVGKPHVMFGAWGYQGKYKGGYSGHGAHNSGMMYGLCNEHGQLNKIGQVLFDKMHEDGLLNNSHVMTTDTHCVVQAKGVQELLEHYNITTPSLAKEVAENIAGQELSQAMIDEPTADWDSLAEQIAGKIPEGGANDISPEVVEQTSEAINVPAEPKMPEGANPTQWHFGKVISHTQRLQAAYEAADQTAIDKHQDLLNVAVENAQSENIASEKELSQLVEPVLSNSLKDKVMGEAFGGLNPAEDWVGNTAQGIDEPVSPSEQVEDGDEPVSPSDQGQTQTIEAPSDVSTSTPTQTTTPAKTSSDTKKAKVMESLFGDDMNSEDAQIYSDHLDDNPSELDAAYKQHVVNEIVNKQKQKAKDAAKAKVDKEKAENTAKLNEQKKKEKEEADAQKAKAKEEADAAKAKVAEEKQQAKDQAAAEKEQAKQEAIAQKKKEQDANTLPYEVDELEMDEEGNPTNKINDEEATHKALELIAHQKNHQDDMTAETKKKLHDSLVNAKAHGADFNKIKNDFDEMGDDFGSPEHLQQALKNHQDSVDKHNTHEAMITGADEHAESVSHAFEHGSSDKYQEFNSEGKPWKNRYKRGEGKDDISVHAHDDQAKTHTDDGQALHEAHPLASMSPFEKEKFKDLKEAKAKGDEEGVNKAKKALQDVGFDTSKLDIHEDDQPKTGPPDPEVAKQKMAEGYVWHEETRHWILKETLDDLHGQHGSAQLGNTASIIDAGHGGGFDTQTGEQTSKPFAVGEDGSASGSQFVLHGGGKLHQIGSGETPKGAAHYSQITGNALKHHLGDKLAEHNAKGGGVTKLKGFDSKSGKLTNNIQYGKGAKGKFGQAFSEFKDSYAENKAKSDAGEGWKMPSTAKIVTTAATGGANLAAGAAWKKFKPKFFKAEDSAVEMFINKYTPQDVIDARDLLEHVSKPKAKKARSGYNKEMEDTHV